MEKCCILYMLNGKKGVVKIKVYFWCRENGTQRDDNQPAGHLVGYLAGWFSACFHCICCQLLADRQTTRLLLHHSCPPPASTNSPKKKKKILCGHSRFDPEEYDVCSYDFCLYKLVGFIYLTNFPLLNQSTDSRLKKKTKK